MTVEPPWTVVLTAPQHDLILAGMAVAALALLATLVRVRFASSESHGPFRAASLTANAVVAIAFVSYAALVLAFVLGYRLDGDVYRPTAVARFAWELRYVDWAVTVPLLVVELIGVSILTQRSATVVRGIGMFCGVGMIVSGFLGAFIVNDGRDLASYTVLGLVGALFFAVLYGLFFGAFTRTLPRLPGVARPPYKAAVILLLIIWLAYPAAYGLSGAVPGATAAVAGQLVLCAADVIAKIGFGTLVHRTAVLRSRADEELNPTTERRPRLPQSDSLYVDDTQRVDFDAL